MQVPKVFITVIILIVLVGLAITQLLLLQWIDTGLLNALHIALFLVSIDSNANR